MLYGITNRVGDQVSLFTICLETQNVFLQDFFACNNNSVKSS